MSAWVMTKLSVSKLDKFKFFIKPSKKKISLHPWAQFKLAYLHSVFNNIYFLPIVKLFYKQHICHFFLLYSNLENKFQQP